MENGVEDALKKHARGNGHKVNLLNLTNPPAVRITDFTPDPSSSSASSSVSSSETEKTTTTTTATTTSARRPISTTPTLVPFADGDLVVKAEIKSALRIVKHHSSFNSCVDLGAHYKDIFPDSHEVQFWENQMYIPDKVWYFSLGVRECHQCYVIIPIL